MSDLAQKLAEVLNGPVWDFNVATGDFLRDNADALADRIADKLKEGGA